MNFILLLPAIVSFLMLSAHFLREQSPLLMLASLAMCGLLIVRRRWVARIAQLALSLAVLEWLFTTYAIVQMRMYDGKDWTRAAIILLSVAAFNILAAAMFQTPRLLRRYSTAPSRPADQNADSQLATGSPASPRPAHRL
jgi:hypothetical protein